MPSCDGSACSACSTECRVVERTKTVYVNSNENLEKQKIERLEKILAKIDLIEQAQKNLSETLNELRQDATQTALASSVETKGRKLRNL